MRVHAQTILRAPTHVTAVVGRPQSHPLTRSPPPSFRTPSAIAARLARCVSASPHLPAVSYVTMLLEHGSCVGTGCGPHWPPVAAKNAVFALPLENTFVPVAPQGAQHHAGAVFPCITHVKGPFRFPMRAGLPATPLTHGVVNQRPTPPPIARAPAVPRVFPRVTLMSSALTNATMPRMSRCVRSNPTVAGIVAFWHKIAKIAPHYSPVPLRFSPPARLHLAFRDDVVVLSSRAAGLRLVGASKLASAGTLPPSPSPTGVRSLPVVLAASSCLHTVTRTVFEKK
jgi:hypothetical protein